MTPAQKQYHAAESERKRLRLIASMQPAKPLDCLQQLKELGPMNDALDKIESAAATADDYHTIGARYMWGCEFALARLTSDAVPILWAGHCAVAEAWLQYQRGATATPEQIAAMRAAAGLVAEMLEIVHVKEHMIAVVDGLDANQRANWADDFKGRWEIKNNIEQGATA